VRPARFYGKPGAIGELPRELPSNERMNMPPRAATKPNLEISDCPVAHSGNTSVSGTDSAKRRPSGTPCSLESPPDTVSRQRQAECHHNYPVFHLSDRARVIECRDGIQWILQLRRSIGEQLARGCILSDAGGAPACAAGTDSVPLDRVRSLPERFVGRWLSMVISGEVA
jgi:hypothetical protein